MFYKKRRNNKGFSLIELVVVVAILGILTAVAVPVYGQIQKTAKRTATQTQAQNSATIVENYVSNGYNLSESGDYSIIAEKDEVKKTIVAGDSEYSYWLAAKGGDWNDSPVYSDQVCVVAGRKDDTNIRASDGIADNCKGNTWDKIYNNGADYGYDAPGDWASPTK